MPHHVGLLTLDMRRGRAPGILANPWQTGHPPGDWKLFRVKVFEQHRYKTAKSVIQQPDDIVSKNGT